MLNKYSDTADEICKTYKESYFIPECVLLQDRILESIRQTSLNVFVFLKAFPLVDLVNRWRIGPMTQKHNNFKEWVLESMKNENKILQVKFDVLTRDNLKSIKNYGWRVLHLSSDEYRDLELCAEGKYGELDLIKISELHEYLITSGDKLNIDVVVLAIPQSKLIAEAFVKLGVRHVIYFEFSDEFFDQYCDFDSELNIPYEWIYTFWAQFYRWLVKGSSVDKAMKRGLEHMKWKISEKNKLLWIEEVYYDKNNEGPILLPKNGDHNQQLYGSKDWDSIELQLGHLIDMSKRRGQTNVVKSCSPFTGRKDELYRLIKYLHEFRLVTLHGLPGIGKTRLAQSASYFLNSRYYFNTGNYYFDLMYIKTADQWKKLMKEQGWNTMNEDTLLIFDHADLIWKRHGTHFRWWILDITNRFKSTILLITRDWIFNELQDWNVIEVK